MERKTLVFVCLLVIGLMVASTVPAGAKKPSSPPDDGGSDPVGTIYYLQSDEDHVTTFWTMDGDGDNKAQLSNPIEGSMSLTTHKDGHYWNVYFEQLTTTHPDGKHQTELWTVRDDGSCRQELWSNEDLVYMDWNGPICWMTDDAAISWVTWYINSDGTISDPGVYTATVSWGTDDNTPTLGTPQKAYDTGAIYFKQHDEYRARGTYPNWSADGEKLVYLKNDYGVALVDFSTTPPTETVLGYTNTGKISPDGTMIAVVDGGQSLLMVDIDGTNERTIDVVKDKGTLWNNLLWYQWSPDGKHLTYSIVSMNSKTWEMSSAMYVIGADGDGKTSVTKSTRTCDWYVPVTWR
jgi:hypothetical protein